jgi:hypothetical protein
MGLEDGLQGDDLDLTKAEAPRQLELRGASSVGSGSVGRLVRGRVSVGSAVRPAALQEQDAGAAMLGGTSRMGEKTR